MSQQRQQGAALQSRYRQSCKSETAWFRRWPRFAYYRRRRDMFEPLTRKFTDWRLRRIAIRKLHTLDDRLLADVGTTRDDIACFVSSIQCRGVA